MNIISSQTFNIKTDYHQLEQLLIALPKAPLLIPLIANDKRPDLKAGQSWTDPNNQLTPEQALERLKQGKNVGIIGSDWLCIVDLDNPAKYRLNKKTLTVKTRSGSLHQYYLHDGTIENADAKNDLKGCGEVRVENKYVVAPGSYVTPNPEDQGNGLYHIIENNPIAFLEKTDLPPDFLPTEKTLIPINPEILNSTVPLRNHRGTSLDEFRKRDPKLNDLLNGQDLTGDTSRDDASTLNHLINDCEFTEPEAIAILKKFRYRPKLERPDYIQNTLNHITRREPNPIYQLNLQQNQPTTTVQTGLNGEHIETTVTQKTKTKPAPQEDPNSLKNIIRDLKDTYIFKTPTDTLELHQYINGIYVPAERDIESDLEIRINEKLSTHTAKEIINHLKRSSYIPRTEINKYTEYIPIENGLLNLKTGTLDPYSPDQVFTFKIPLQYDSTADCPNFKQWLSEVQTPENIALLQEYAGYTLLPQMPYHKALLLYGEGRNGKTTFTNTIENLLGTQNCAHIELQDLNGDNRFNLSRLYGKLLNIAQEPTVKKALETAILKKLLGNDTIEAELKNIQQPLVFKSFAKWIMSANKYPRINDKTTAFYQRIIIMKWEKQFLEGQNQKQQIENTWLNNPTERCGILNWMIQGLQRLTSQGHFSVTKNQEETMIEFKRVSNSFDAWLMERVTFHPQSYTTRQDAYNDYIAYCEQYGLYAIKEQSFTGQLRDTPKIIDMFKKIFGKSTRVWKGIELKPLPEQDNLEQAQVKDTLDTLDTPISSQNNENKNNITRYLEKENGVPCVSSVSHTQPVLIPDAKHSIFSENEVMEIEEMRRNASFTPPTTPTEVCYFCGSNYVEGEVWLSGPFSFDNPAHLTCYRSEEEKSKQKFEEKK